MPSQRQASAQTSVLRSSWISSAVWQDLNPNAVVIVATVRALKYNGGVAKADLNNENLEALEKGLPNLLKHVSNITNVYKLPCVVAINAFPTDTKAELDLVENEVQGAWRKRCSVRGMGKGRRRRHQAGRGSHPSVRGAERLHLQL